MNQNRFPVMCVGHIVLAEIVKQVGGNIECRFICHMDSGSEHLCLDYGQNWYIRRGETFTVSTVQFERALELIADTRMRVLDLPGWLEKQRAEIEAAGY